VVPWGGFPGRQTLPPHQVISAMVQDLLFCHEFDSVSLRRLGETKGIWRLTHAYASISMQKR
jgi:hypothetical protein